MNEELMIKRTAEIASKWWGDRLQQGDPTSFIKALEPKIKKSLTINQFCEIENDYDPIGILLEALNEAGIKCRGTFFSGQGIFPNKHYLYVESGKLRPKEGYGNWGDEIDCSTEPLG